MVSANSGSARGSGRSLFDLPLDAGRFRLRRIRIAMIPHVVMEADRRAIAHDRQRRPPRKQGQPFAGYGSTCDYFGQPATIAGAWDALRCELTISFTVSRTCCNTFA